MLVYAQGWTLASQFWSYTPPKVGFPRPKKEDSPLKTREWKYTDFASVFLYYVLLCILVLCICIKQKAKPAWRTHQAVRTVCDLWGGRGMSLVPAVPVAASGNALVDGSTLRIGWTSCIVARQRCWLTWSWHYLSERRTAFRRRVDLHLMKRMKKVTYAEHAVASCHGRTIWSS